MQIPDEQHMPTVQASEALTAIDAPPAAAHIRRVLGDEAGEVLRMLGIEVAA